MLGIVSPNDVLGTSVTHSPKHGSSRCHVATLVISAESIIKFAVNSANNCGKPNSQPAANCDATFTCEVEEHLNVVSPTCTFLSVMLSIKDRIPVYSEFDETNQPCYKIFLRTSWFSQSLIWPEIICKP